MINFIFPLTCGNVRRKALINFIFPLTCGNVRRKALTHKGGEISSGSRMSFQPAAVERLSSTSAELLKERKFISGVRAPVSLTLAKRNIPNMA